MFVESCVVSHVGRIRKNNEDNFFLNGLYRQGTQETCLKKTQEIQGARFVFAVCDGMGGEEYGETASLCAARMLGVFKEDQWSVGLMQKYIDNVKTDMVNESSSNVSQGMGCTLALLCIENNTAHIANIGDSRIYLYRDNELIQLTKDHTQAGLLVEDGLLTPDEARKHRGGHILTRYLGIDSGITADDVYHGRDIKLCKGDIFILCSDGLTDMLDNEGIDKNLHILYRENTASIAEKLCKDALCAGGRDNITCLAVKVKRKNGIFLKFEKKGENL